MHMQGSAAPSSGAHYTTALPWPWLGEVQPLPAEPQTPKIESGTHATLHHHEQLSESGLNYFPTSGGATCVTPEEVPMQWKQPHEVYFPSPA